MTTISKVSIVYDGTFNEVIEIALPTCGDISHIDLIGDLEDDDRIQIVINGCMTLCDTVYKRWTAIYPAPNEPRDPMWIMPTLSTVYFSTMRIRITRTVTESKRLTVQITEITEIPPDHG